MTRHNPHPRLALAAFTAALVVLSGCAANQASPEGSSDASASPGPTSVIPTESSQSTGRVIGQVVDDEFLPVEASRVWFIDHDWEATTGLDGAFAFEGVPTGRYTLLAEREGFEPDSREVSVGADSESEVRLRLVRDVRANQPYANVVPFSGMLGCGVGSYSISTIDACQNYGLDENADHDVTIPYGAGLNAISYEVTWTPNQAFGAEQLGVIGGPGSFYGDCRSQGASPLRWACEFTQNETNGNWLSEDNEVEFEFRVPSKGGILADEPENWTNNPVVVAIQQRFDATFTFYHWGMEVPAEYPRVEPEAGEAS